MKITVTDFDKFASFVERVAEYGVGLVVVNTAAVTDMVLVTASLGDVTGYAMESAQNYIHNGQLAELTKRSAAAHLTKLLLQGPLPPMRVLLLAALASCGLERGTTTDSIPLPPDRPVITTARINADQSVTISQRDYIALQGYLIAVDSWTDIAVGALAEAGIQVDNTQQVH